MNINEIRILDIQPSQFYISEKKIDMIKRWFNPYDLSNFEPIPIKDLNGALIFTDGHTRAYVAYQAGLSQVPLIWDDDELDWQAYQICVSACKKRGIKSIADLGGRILSHCQYIEKWDGWCDVMHEILELQTL